MTRVRRIVVSFPDFSARHFKPPSRHTNNKQIEYTYIYIYPHTHTLGLNLLESTCQPARTSSIYPKYSTCLSTRLFLPLNPNSPRRLNLTFERVCMFIPFGWIFANFRTNFKCIPFIFHRISALWTFRGSHLLGIFQLIPFLAAFVWSRMWRLVRVSR